MDNIIKELEAAAELDGIEEYREKYFTYYNYNNIGVPRTTNIIKQCENQEALIKWATRMGYKANNIRNKSTVVGTAVHEKIENYLKYLICGTSDTEDLYLPNEDYISDDYCRTIDIAYKNFKYWITYITNLGIRIEEIYGIELTITTPWYGGTIDCIIKINGAWYIVDFKTSTSIVSSYFIQASAYMWAINNGYLQGAPHINGIGIIRVDKTQRGKFDDVFLNDFDHQDAIYIRSYQECFFSYLNAYYRAINVNYITENYMDNYNIENVLKENENEDNNRLLAS